MNSETFVSGFLGHGMRLRKNGENWELELDNLIVRKSMTVYELIVQEIRYQAGQHIFGPAGAKLLNVPIMVHIGVVSMTEQWTSLQERKSYVQRFEGRAQAEKTPDGWQQYLKTHV